MKAAVIVMSSAALAAGGLLGLPAAHADTNSVTTPLGALEMTLDGGAFSEECTDFAYFVTVTGATPDVQWTAEIDAERDGGGSVSGMVTDIGSGTFPEDLQICSSDGAGSWTATVQVMMRDTTDTTAVYNRTMTIDFIISKASTTTTITNVNLGSSRTKVKGTVLDAAGGSETTMFGYVTVKVKKSGGSWKSKGRTQVDEDGRWSLTIETSYATGTKFKAVYEGSDEAKRSTSAGYTS
jgi:hypothetical protein